MDGGAAQAAGLMAGDRVEAVNGVAVKDGQHLRSLIRSGVGPQG